MSLNREQARLLTVVVAMVGLFAAGLWYPQQRRAWALRGQVTAAQAELQENRVKLVGVTAVAEEVNQLAQTLTAAPRVVPRQSDLAELIRELTASIDRHNLADAQVVTSPVVDGKNFSVIPLRLECKGSFPSINRFVSEIEAARRVVRVAKLEVWGDPQDSTKPLQARMEIWAFFAPNAKEPK